MSATHWGYSEQREINNENDKNDKNENDKNDKNEKLENDVGVIKDILLGPNLDARKINQTLLKNKY